MVSASASDVPCSDSPDVSHLCHLRDGQCSPGNSVRHLDELSKNCILQREYDISSILLDDEHLTLFVCSRFLLVVDVESCACATAACEHRPPYGNGGSPQVGSLASVRWARDDATGAVRHSKERGVPSFDTNANLAHSAYA